MKLVAMSGNQLCGDTLACTLVYNCHEPLSPALYNVATLTASCQWTWAVARGGSIWKAWDCSCFNWTLHDKAWPVVCCCDWWGFQRPPISCRYHETKTQSPGLTRSFWLNLPHCLRIDFWIGLLVASIPAMQCGHGQTVTRCSLITQPRRRAVQIWSGMTRLVSLGLGTNHEPLSFHDVNICTNFVHFYSTDLIHLITDFIPHLILSINN